MNGGDAYIEGKYSTLTFDFQPPSPPFCKRAHDSHLRLSSFLPSAKGRMTHLRLVSPPPLLRPAKDRTILIPDSHLSFLLLQAPIIRPYLQ